jgi:RNA polymerase sigma-B factor
MRLHPESRPLAPLASSSGMTGQRAASRPAGNAGKVRRLELLRAFRENGDLASRDRLVADCAPLVSGIARDFANRGEQVDDLIQVGFIGLLKAIARFDTGRRVEFSTYASTAILGEIRHHVRDNITPIRIPRGLSDLHVRLSAQRAELILTLGRIPTNRELASAAGVTATEVGEALQIRSASRPRSLSAATVGDDAGSEIGLVELIGRDDPGYQAAENRLHLAPALVRLGPHERRALSLRYGHDLTQARIAAELGVSQTQVSRILRKAVNTLGESVAAA